MKKSLIAGFAVICAALLAGCTGSGNSAPPSGGQAPPNASSGDAKPPTGAGGKKTIAFVFKSAGQYSEVCKKGSDQANDELKASGTSVEYYAPDKADVGKQIQLMEQFIAKKYDAIVISPNDDKAVAPIIAKAIEAGVKVYTWDSDAAGSKRIFYVAAADDVQIGVDIAEALAKDLGGKGKVAIMAGGRAAANQNLHVKGLEDGFKKSPGITVMQPYIYNEEDQAKAVEMAKTALQKDPDLAGFACVNSQGPPGVGEAVDQLKKIGKVKVWGLALPSATNKYLHSGALSGVMLWDPAQLTYLTAILVNDDLAGKAPEDGKDYKGIGKIKVKKDKDGTAVIIPGITFTKDNVDKYTF